jgi:DNA-binding transcriptional MocR family regulator
MNKPEQWRYQEVVRLIRSWIDSGVLKPGERLRSIRDMSLQTGFSVVTVHHAYSLLESEGVLEARPRSGYFVAKAAEVFSEFPHAQSDFVGKPDEASVGRRLFKLMGGSRELGMERFGSLHPSSDLFPYEEIGPEMRRAFREHPPRLKKPAPVAGDSTLREIIAKRAAFRGALAHTEDVIVAGTQQSALELSLDALTKPGDTVLIETPSYFPLFSALQRRQLKVIEIYSHPQTGIDPEQFEYLLSSDDVRACLLMPVNHYPTGVTYSNEVLARIVAAATARQIPVIENDAYGELLQGGSQASSLKTFDASDFVLQVGSFAATLGPLYGLAWIINQRYRERLLERQFFNEPAAGHDVVQRAIASYILRRSYDRHLRRMREQLEIRMRRGLVEIAQQLPAKCAVSRPSGGFMCWMRFPSNFDSLKTADRAMQRGLGFIPGPLFSISSSFRNFVGLNLSFEWNEETENDFLSLCGLLAQGIGP